MTYVMLATRLGIAYQSLDVEVQADFDARGYHGVDGIRPGYQALRYIVSVESDEPESAVLAWLDESDAHCDFLADAEQLGQDDEAFDAALCSLGLMYVSSPPEALAEMRCVLVPGGRVAVSVWGNLKNCGWAEIFGIVDARVQSQVCPMFFQLGAGESLRYRLEEAGFVEIDIERMNTVLHYDSEESALGAAFVGGPVALAYSKFDEATREEVHAEYLESIEDYREGERYAVPGEFVVAVAHKAPTSAASRS